MISLGPKKQEAVILIRTKEQLPLACPPHLGLFLRNTVFSVANQRSTRAENVATMLSRCLQKTSRIKIQEACRVRNDEWAETVRGRLEFAQDLHAADAVYHQACSVNFRTGKQFPKKHGNDTDSKHAKGRPMDPVKSKAFLQVTEFLVENDEEQLTIPDLVGKMQEYLEGTGELPYSAVCIKEKLKEHFGEKIVIITVNNRNVVTFHSTAALIISEFYKQPKVDDYEVEKSRIVEAAAKLITSDKRT